MIELRGIVKRFGRLVAVDHVDLAIAQADAAEVVLIAGKGHEDYQEIQGTRHPFSDMQVARRAQARRIADGPANLPPGGVADV